jgi:hypothetical protein
VDDETRDAAAEPSSDTDHAPTHDGGSRAHDGDHPARDLVVEAALEAERRTGRAEETDEELRRGVAIRIARMVGGFVLIGIGIALLPLPGPGWLTIVIGLSLLPFAWAERTILLIRQRVPGIPAEGRIPPRTWVIMGLLTATFVAGSILLGDVIGRWLSDAWSAIWS